MLFIGPETHSLCHTMDNVHGQFQHDDEEKEEKGLSWPGKLGINGELA